jgi:hypothetical protein
MPIIIKCHRCKGKSKYNSIGYLLKLEREDRLKFKDVCIDDCFPKLPHAIILCHNCLEQLNQQRGILDKEKNDKLVEFIFTR